MIGNSAEQPAEVELVRVSLGNPPQGGTRKLRSWNYHAVVEVLSRANHQPRLWINRAYDQTGARIDRDCFGRIVEARIEDDHVPPFRAVGHDHGVTETVINGEVLAHLPCILRKTLPHVAAKDGIGAMPDL